MQLITAYLIAVLLCFTMMTVTAQGTKGTDRSTLPCNETQLLLGAADKSLF